VNYSEEIKRINTLLGMDKGISPKWRNKAVARLDEAEAFIAKGMKESDQYRSAQSGFDQLGECICINYPSSINKNCPVHAKQI
jgi:hypothetical protein